MIVAKVDIQMNADAFMKATRAKLAQRMMVVANDLKDRIRRDLSISNRQGIYPAFPGEPPHHGNGDLARSLYAEQVDENTWHVGTRGVPYGALQELGGIIRSNKWMPVPTSRAAQAHRSRKGMAREFPKPLHFRPVHGRSDIAFLVEGHGDAEVIHYTLKKEVYIPAHPYLRPAAHDPEFRRRAMALLGGTAESVGTTMMAETAYAGHVQQWIGH